MNHPSKGERRLSTPLKSRFREQVRIAILDSAEHELGAQGLHAARMEDIAARAGVSVGTLYNYFGDRDHLIQTLLGERGDDLLLELDAVLQQPFTGFVPQLGDFLSAMFQHFERHRRLFSRVFEGTEGQPRGGRKELKRQVVERLGRLVAKGVEAGELNPSASEFYPALLMGMAHGAIAHAIFDPGAAPASAETRVAACVRVFVDGARRAS